MESFEQSPNRPENIEQIDPERLWENPDVITISFRRHSAYDYYGKEVPIGSLTKKGIELARVAAKDWISQIPENSNVTIYESPSYEVAGKREFPELHDVLPRRATITASIYEKEVFGNLAKSTQDEETGLLQSTRRKQSGLLGDFFEQADNDQEIENFFQVQEQVYGDDKKFWEDYYRNQLDEDVEEALKKAKGSTSSDEAANVKKFITQIVGSKIEGKKNINLAVTHGEVMTSFLSSVFQRLGLEVPITDIEFDYNLGFDIHIKNDQLVIVIPNMQPLVINMAELK